MKNNTWQRREFVATVLTALGGSMLPALSMAQVKTGSLGAMTVNEVIELILKSIPGAPFKDTVDTIKSGDPAQLVKGIVTTMFATDAVIQQTIGKGANFIIAHEPTFYNHLDNTDWLQQDEVYRFKKELLEKHNIVVWRFHDYWHAHQPDGIDYGVLQSLGWEKLMDKHGSAIIELPFALSLHDIMLLLKKRLGVHTLRVMGNAAQLCRRIAILPGMAGGTEQIEILSKGKPDLMICGELNEWETSEYIRDAQYQGMKTALIVTGHAQSEEPGMRWLVEWLQPQIPGIPVMHIPSGDPFTYV